MNNQSPVGCEILQCTEFIYQYCHYLGHNLDDIKTVYHPSTGKPPLIQTLQDYNATEIQQRVLSEPPEAPWRPYATRLDFEFSEFAMTAYLNAEHVEKLIMLLNIAATRQDKLTITSNAELVKIRQSASTILTPVCLYS